jgi:Fur family peroxide stress response transcriptional regulator
MGKMTIEEKKAKLKEKGVLLTIQRSAVLEFLQDNTEHPTAEEIYQSLRGIYPALARATIYNTLDLLKQHGLIQEITIERNKAHYDYKIEPHHHFLCSHCARIYDVALEKVPCAQEEWLDGHKMEAAWLYMTGTCATCLRAGNDA